VPLATTRRAGLVDQVIEQLRTSVTSGEWPVGTRIPIEPELAEALGVGRNTVREAVRALAHAGIFEVRQGAGTYVRASSEVSGALKRLCGQQLREVLQVRRCLEVEGARLAAAARTDDDIAGLKELLAQHNSLLRRGDRMEFVRIDTDLHLAVVRASHNAVLLELYRGLTEVVMSSVATATEGDAGNMFSHADLIAAIIDGDVERAGTEAGAFLDEVLAQLTDQPAESRRL